jgi:hypothetical protein
MHPVVDGNQSAASLRLGMQSDVDWVGRDLQRLARESKLLRSPTEAEWQAIWQAATKWADAYGVVANGVPIDEFVRKHAPGALRENAPAPSGTNPQVDVPVAQSSAAQPVMNVPVVAAGVVRKPDPRERGRRYPKIRVKPAA